METLRHVVVLIHIVGFAITFGAWVVEAAARRFRATPLMNIGLGISLISGLALAAPWGISYELDYTKIAVKLVILVVLGGLMGAASGIQRKRASAPPAALFWAIGILSLANAAIAVLWR